MTRLICPYDPTCPIEPGDRICPVHRDDLVPAPSDGGENAGDTGSAGPDLPNDPGAGREDTCWRCQRTLPDRYAPTCPECDASQPAPALALIFDKETIVLECGERAILGRAPDTPHASTLSASNISRHHAVAWVDPDGTSWIRDTDSTNGTSINGEELEPDKAYQLPHQGFLCLAADNRARIFVRRVDP